MKNGLLILLIGISFGLQAQQLDTNWVKQYDRTGASREAEIVEVDSNKYVIQYGKNYYEINSNGDSLASGTLDDTLGNLGPNCFASDGKYFYAGGSSDNGPLVAKLDTNYNVLWVTTLTTVNFGEGVEALLIDGADIYASGSHSSSNPFAAKLDKSGNMAWMKEFPQSIFSNLTDIIKLKDGHFLASGNLDDYPFAIKFDNAGDTAWTYTEPIFISFSNAAGAEMPDSSLLVVCRNTLVKLSKNGMPLDTIESLNNYSDILIDGDTVYLFGTRKYTRFGGDQFAYVETRDLNLDSTSAWQYDWMSHPSASNAFQNVIQRPTGGFIAVGRHRDTVNTSANTWNVLAAMFNSSISSPNPGDTTNPGDSTTTSNAFLNDITSASENIVFPNPTSNFLQFTHTDIQNVKALNAAGKSFDVVLENNRMETSNLPDGLYVIEVRTSDKRYVHKVVIKH